MVVNPNHPGKLIQILRNTLFDFGVRHLNGYGPGRTKIRVQRFHRQVQNGLAAGCTYHLQACRGTARTGYHSESQRSGNPQKGFESFFGIPHIVNHNGQPAGNRGTAPGQLLLLFGLAARLRNRTAAFPTFFPFLRVFRRRRRPLASGAGANARLSGRRLRLRPVIHIFCQTFLWGMLSELPRRRVFPVSLAGAVPAATAKQGNQHSGDQKWNFQAVKPHSLYAGQKPVHV